MLLDGRVAIVSGIGPGMGRDISLTLAKAGADIALAARRSTSLDPVAAEIEAVGRRVVCVPTDITVADDCRALAASAVGQLGRVDVVVNNAFAEEPYSNFAGFDPDRWRAPFEVNVFGSLQLTKAALPALRSAGGGSVVNISTLSIRNPVPTLAGYASSKQALEAASRQLALELRDDGIRVNQVAPGHIWGPSLRGYFEFLATQRGVTPQDVYDEIAAQSALNRIADSEQISRAVLFFASSLSRGITGQTLDVNCGRTLH